MMKQWDEIAQVHKSLNGKGEWLATLSTPPPTNLDLPLLPMQKEIEASLTCFWLVGWLGWVPKRTRHVTITDLTSSTGTFQILC